VADVKIEKTVLLPVDKLDFNDWNPNEMGDKEFSTLVMEIKNEGFDDPVKAVETANGRYRVVDGENRVRAARTLGMKQVPCVVKSWDEVTQMMKTVLRNNLHGMVNDQKLSSLCVRIARQQEVTVDNLARAMLVRDRQLIEDALASLKTPPPGADDGEEFEGKEGDTRLPSERRQQQVVDEAAEEVEEEEQKAKTAKAASKFLAEIETKGGQVKKDLVMFTSDGQKHCAIEASPRLVKALGQMRDVLVDLDMDASDFLADAIERHLTHLDRADTLPDPDEGEVAEDDQQ
jgi:ParB family transcriptional regulator, chromosome partitioning protein